jgi:Fe2+ or Zn2+ uptake regulation protein
VSETLADEVAHLTAPDVVEAVQQRTPGVGWASVYRTLELLTQLRLVQSSTLGGAAATYVLTPSRHHRHVVCVECHKTVEFEECGVREIETASQLWRNLTCSSRDSLESVCI